MPVDVTAQPTGHAQWDSLNHWWNLAGVDAIVDETPCHWLNLAPPNRRAAHNPPSKVASGRCEHALDDPVDDAGRSDAPRMPARARPQSSAIQPVLAPLPDPLPATLDDFLNWWRDAPELPIGNPPSARLAPSGCASADLMILTDMPETGDRGAGGLLAGPLAPMLDRMLAALGTRRDRVWLASLMAVRPVTGRIAPEILPVLGRLAHHQIHLVKPKKLWLMGEAASRAINGGANFPDGGQLPPVNHPRHNHHDHDIVTVSTAHPRLLAANPRHKKAAWLAMQPLRDAAGQNETENDGKAGD